MGIRGTGLQGKRILGINCFLGDSRAATVLCLVKQMIDYEGSELSQLEGHGAVTILNMCSLFRSPVSCLSSQGTTSLSGS